MFVQSRVNSHPSESTYRDGADDEERALGFNPKIGYEGNQMQSSDTYVANEPHNISGASKPSFLNRDKDQIQMASSGGAVLFERGSF